MKLLITGGSGFIGRHVLTHLAATDFEIHVIARRKQSAVFPNVEWHEGDLLQSADITHILQHVRPSHLLHLAWDVTPGQYWTSLNNFKWVQASLYLFEQFNLNGGRRVTVAGTCAEYNWQNGYFVESVHPLSYETAYSTSKVSLYHLLMGYAAQSDLSAAWGRIFFPFGPYENCQRLIPYVINSLLKDQIAETTAGKQIRDFLYVKDVATAFVALLQSDVTHAVNISSGEPIYLRDLVLQIGERLERTELIKLGARTSHNEPPMLVGDSSRLRDEVQWSPEYSLDQALEETILWWQEQP